MRDIMVEEPIGKHLLTSFLLFDSVKVAKVAPLASDPRSSLFRSPNPCSIWNVLGFLDCIVVEEHVGSFLRISIGPNKLTEAQLLFLVYWKWFFHTIYIQIAVCLLPSPFSPQHIPAHPTARFSLLPVRWQTDKQHQDEKQRKGTWDTHALIHKCAKPIKYKIMNQNIQVKV